MDALQSAFRPADAVPDHDVYHCLPNGRIIFGTNCSFIPRSLFWLNGEDPIPIPRLDGFWGLHEYSMVPHPFDAEYPYMSWIPLSGYASFKFPARIRSLTVWDSPSVQPTQFCRHPSWPDRGYLNREIYQVIRDDVFELVEIVRGIVHSYEDHERKRDSFSRNSTLPNPFPDRSGTRFPLLAMQRACAASVALGLQDLLYRDVLEYLAGLKRAVAELHGFIMWHNEVEARENSSIRRVHIHRIRGAIVSRYEDFEVLSRLGIPAWIVISFESLPPLLPSQSVDLADPPSRLDLWAAPGSSSSSVDIHRGKFVHNKSLVFYPPVVDPSVSFERAARGYARRIDQFRNDPRTMRALADMVVAIGELNIKYSSHTLLYLINRRHYTSCSVEDFTGCSFAFDGSNCAHFKHVR